MLNKNISLYDKTEIENKVTITNGYYLITMRLKGCFMDWYDNTQLQSDDIHSHNTHTDYSSHTRARARTREQAQMYVHDIRLCNFVYLHFAIF